MWKKILDFDLRVDGEDTPVKEIVSGKSFHRPLGGLVGVANAGQDLNWLGFDLAMANLYGFGRFAWDPDQTAAQIASEWTGLLSATIASFSTPSRGCFLNPGVFTRVIQGRSAWGP
jgi:alpha-glucuronidase